MNVAHAKLTPKQEEIVDAVLARLLELANSSRRVHETDHASTTNVVGFLGGRGAGKTTLLHALRRRLDASDLARTFFNTGLLDCSVLPEQVAPPAGVLLHVHQALRCHLQERQPPSRSQHAALETALQALRQLAGGHVMLRPEYHALCQDLASSGETYQDAIILGIEHALGVKAQLHRCLADLALGLDVKALVVLLDDFDLVSARTHQGWIQAFLDSLQQPHLLFVLAADLQRLELLGPNEHAELDDITGRALLHQKVLPLHHQWRVPLFEQPSERAGFVAWNSPGPTLETLLMDRAKTVHLGEDMNLLQTLLPRRPRGLEHLYQGLRHDGGASSDPLSFDKASAPTGLADELLQLVARARAEYFLADRIAELPSDGWLKHMHWSSDAEWEQWRATVDNAARQERSAPLPSIVPVSQAVRDDASRRHSTRWLEPLRHDEQRHDPLRDAEGADRALWAELLVNRSIRESPSRRARFLEAWHEAWQRAAQAQLSVEFTREQLWQFFEEDAPLYDILVWFSDRPRNGARSYVLDLGWAPLLAALRGARRLWPGRLMADLLVPPAKMARSGAGSPVFQDDPLALLPGDVRALVLFVDALDRCPWEAFSRPHFGWRVTTYVLLAGAFVRSAYVSALARRLPDVTSGPSQKRMLARLETADPGLRAEPSLGERSTALLQEDEWRDELRHLYAEPLPLDLGLGLGPQNALRGSQTGPDALLAAAQVFFRSPAYGALEQLAQAPSDAGSQ